MRAGVMPPAVRPSPTASQNSFREVSKSSVAGSASLLPGSHARLSGGGWAVRPQAGGGLN